MWHVTLGAWWPLLVLIAIVSLLLLASQHPAWQPAFRWLPIPLWCYGLPMILRALGWLPASVTVYPWVTDQLLPVALGLLLLGVDLAALRRIGAQALMAMLVGAAGIVVGGPLMLWALHSRLPPESWKGIGMLAATWTGGSLNLLALRTILAAPDTVFAPLIVVDALIAYSWMAGLVAAKGLEPRINRWLNAVTVGGLPSDAPSGQSARDSKRSKLLLGCATAIVLTAGCHWLAQPLPLSGLVASTAGWTVLLVTTTSLALSCAPAVRRLGSEGSVVGYPCLYLVLAALGAQANLTMLVATPLWLVVGVGWVAFHAATLLLAGRLLRVPLGVLATASQANVGGVVSAPLVGAVYDQALAPVGLLLAILGNAVGTYLGLLAAWLGRFLVGQP